MRKLTQGICVILLFAFLLPVTAYAATDTTERASAYFTADSCYLYQTSSTKFDICFDVTGTGMMDEIGAKSVKLQRSSDGVNWTTMKTFTKDSYPDMVDTNTSFHAWEYSYTGSAGYSYRAVVQFYAKKGTGSASLTRYTTPLDL